MKASCDRLVGQHWQTNRDIPYLGCLREAASSNYSDNVILLNCHCRLKMMLMTWQVQVEV